MSTEAAPSLLTPWPSVCKREIERVLMLDPSHGSEMYTILVIYNKKKLPIETCNNDCILIEEPKIIRNLYPADVCKFLK